MVRTELERIIETHASDNENTADTVVTDLRTWKHANGRAGQEAPRMTADSDPGPDHRARLAAVLDAVGADIALARLRALMDDT